MKILYVVNEMPFIERLGIMTLSAISKQRGHESILGIVTRQNMLKIIDKEKPNLVAISAMSIEAPALKPLIAKIKSEYNNLIVIMGGPLPTYKPELIDEWNVDAFFIGESDLAYMEFLKALELGKDYSQIANIVTRERRNPLKPLIQDLDTVPMPDRELVYYKGSHLRNLNVKSFMTSRGCKYRCTYCFNSRYNKMYQGLGKIHRRFSVDRIIEEISRVKADYVLDFVRFGDDIFAYNIDGWLEEFAPKYRKKINLPFYCLIRPDLVTPELVKILRYAGCASVSLSIDTGNEDVRKKVLLRNMSDETILNAFKNLHGVGINTYTNTMLGIPYTTTEQELEGVELAAKVKATLPQWTVFIPYRGCDLGKLAYRENLVEGSLPVDSIGYSVLKCFTKKEKNIQLNIAHLGIFAVRLPLFKNLITKKLIYLPPNPVFSFLWFVYNYYIGQKYIWPLRISFVEKIKFFIRVLAYESKFMKLIKSKLARLKRK